MTGLEEAPVVLVWKERLLYPKLCFCFISTSLVKAVIEGENSFQSLQRADKQAHMSWL